MNASTDQIHNIVSLFSEEVRHIIVFVPGHADADACAAAMGWAEVLRSQGKEAEVIAPSTLRVSSDELPGVEEFTHELGADNLIITLPYIERKIDLVTSHVGESSGKFYITVKPRVGERPLDAEDVEISHGGVSADALVLLGVDDISQMEPFVSEYYSLFNEVPSLVMVKNGTPEFGSIRMQGEYGRSVSEESAQLFLQLGWEVNEVAATALLRGVELATDYLAAPSVTAETFEAVAALLRAGAKRIRRPSRAYFVDEPAASRLITNTEEDMSTKSLAEILAQRQAQLQSFTKKLETTPRIARSDKADRPNTSERQPERKPSQATSVKNNDDSQSKKRRRRRRKNHSGPVTGYAGRKS